MGQAKATSRQNEQTCVSQNNGIVLMYGLFAALCLLSSGSISVKIRESNSGGRRHAGDITAFRCARSVAPDSDACICLALSMQRLLTSTATAQVAPSMLFVAVVVILKLNSIVRT